MYPVLFHLGPLPVHTYGFLIAVGFLVAVAVVRRLSSRSGLDPEKMTDLSYLCLLTGFLGARILFVITRFDEFMADPIAIFRVWEGGLVFWGGPVTVVPFLFWYLKKHRLPVWKVVDAFSPGLVIAHAFGRLGCFAAGCCYGRPTQSGFGIKFYSDLVERGLRGVPLHPTQLYESFSLMILFFGLLYIFRTKKFDGQVFFSYFMAYPIIRSIIEAFRGDLVRGFVFGGLLSTSQFISIIVFVAALVGLIFRLKKSDGTRPATHARTR